MSVWQVRANPTSSLDESYAVTVVLLHPGRDRENVGVEDDVLGQKANLLDQDVVGAFGDCAFALQRVALSLLVEGHHHDRGAVTAHGLGLCAEYPLAPFHAHSF